MHVQETILILDFGSQYSKLIARRIREAKVYCEVVSHDISWKEIETRAPKGIILSGGPSSVYAEGAPKCDARLFESDIPILGICYGLQLIAHTLGGQVSRAEKREYGKADVFITKDTPLTSELPESLTCWMSHSDHVEKLPEEFISVARSENTDNVIIQRLDIPHYGVQFHPEVVHTPLGKEILRNFVYKICGCTQSWTPESFVEKSVSEIREKIGSGKVVCALSGGIDSSVAAILVHKAVGSQLTCVFVNNGLLRKGEPEQVVETFRGNYGLNLVYVDAEERFLNVLDGVTEPEQKRKLIGNEFIRVFEDEANKLGTVDFLVQGTLYPDVIESTSNDTAGVAAKIKSHHNVGGLPKDLKFTLVEPLRYLFKDEVRAVAKELGLPDAIVKRQPFPGPGLAIRIIGEVTRDRLDILREADAIIQDEIRNAGLYDSLWQSFAILPALRSVGVMGDERTYAYPIVLRAVTSEDAMTVDWARLPYDLLERISSRVINEVAGVNRMAYDISSKPPATIEWE